MTLALSSFASVFQIAPKTTDYAPWDTPASRSAALF